MAIVDIDGVCHPIDTACCPGWDDLDDDELKARAATLAWNTLSLLTAGRVGSCPVTIRPCLTDSCTACMGFWMNPYVFDGRWFNCPQTGGCSCAPLCEIVLPGIASELIRVSFNGVDLPLTDFRIDDFHRVVREDGECWPSCQHMERALGEEGTLGITYQPGVAIDASALWAAGTLTCEYLKACRGGKCRLPSNVTALVRQGVAMELTPRSFATGTGITEIDAYVATLNPNGLRIPPKVWSPDMASQRHRTTTWVGA